MPEVRQLRTVRAVSIVTLVSQIVIVLTGGLVRLTESGLGCTDWPHCTPDAFFPVPEHGIHGFIEYANRVWGAVVIGISLWMLVLAFLHRARPGGRRILTLAILVAAVTLLQGLIGAIVVWMELRPDTVGIHFGLSVLLVVMSSMLVWRVFTGARGPLAVTRLQQLLTRATAVAFALVVVMGTLTTGAGPHAGDGGAVRNGLDPVVMSHLHAWPSYALGILSLTIAVLAARNARSNRAHMLSTAALLAGCLLQMIIGIIQSNTGLPIALVAIHMIGSVLTAAAMAFAYVTMHGRAATA